MTVISPFIQLVDRNGRLTPEGVRLLQGFVARDASAESIDADARLDALEIAVDALDGLSVTFETVNKNLAGQDATLVWTGGDLATITYSGGVVKTFAFTGDDVVSITLSGATPSGIDLVKTYTYTGSDITAITYS